VRRQRDGKVWNLSNSSITVNEVDEYGPYFGYDKNGCIVWSMSGVGSYRDGDVFDVTISGDRSSTSYTVTFFDLYPVGDITFATKDGTSVQTGSTYDVPLNGWSQNFIVTPGFVGAAYPSQPELQSIAEEARTRQSITYTSSNTGVATVKPLGAHDHWYVYEKTGKRIPADWYLSVTPKAVGTTTITATLADGLSRSFRLVVGKKSIDPSADYRAQVSAVGSETFTYNGKAQHPEYRVRYNGTTLVKGTNYTVSYGNDVNAGTGTATIRGIGGYGGVVTKRFTIRQANVASASVAPISSQVYTGSAIQPKVTVTFGGLTLVEGVDYTVSYSNNINVGTAGVTITGKGNYAGTRSATFGIERAQGPAQQGAVPNAHVAYRTHVQSYGWQGYVSDGTMSGTSGKSKRLEGINIQLESPAYDGSIEYRTHVQKIGWQGYVADGAMSGTSGRSLRLEAIQIRLTGRMAQEYDVWYRVHAQTYGWLGWARNDSPAGTAGYGKRLEGIQVVMLPKGANPPGSTSRAFVQR
jgi:uncharacterized protein YjdB